MDVEPQKDQKKGDSELSAILEALKLPPDLISDQKPPSQTSNSPPSNSNVSVDNPVSTANPAIDLKSSTSAGASLGHGAISSWNLRATQNSPSNIDQNRGVNRLNRVRTGLRLHYEAEVAIIQKQIGSLEKIRADLGLSARKICQLLMVDPSAWNRWTQPGSKAPPHIWRALQWYTLAQEKLPGLTPNFFLARPSTPVGQAKFDPQLTKQVQDLEGTHRDLLSRIRVLEDKSNHLVEELRSSQRTVRVYEFAGSMIGLMILGFVIFLFMRSRH